MPAGSWRRIASIRLTASTIFRYCSSDSWRRLPIALEINIRSFASSACSAADDIGQLVFRLLLNPFLNRSKRGLFLVQLLAKALNEMRGVSSVPRRSSSATISSSCPGVRWAAFRTRSAQKSASSF